MIHLFLHIIAYASITFFVHRFSHEVTRASKKDELWCHFGFSVGLKLLIILVLTSMLKGIITVTGNPLIDITIFWYSFLGS